MQEKAREAAASRRAAAVVVGGRMPHWSRAALGFVVACAALVAAGSAHAQDRRSPPPSGPLDAARALEKRGDTLGAARSYGQVIAKAQAAADLALEDAAAQGLEALIDAAPADRAGESKATSAAPGRAALLAAVMEKLDANRCGAFVSAPCLAREILQSATRTGDPTHVPSAAAVLAAHATKSASGRGALVVAKYAEGMKALLVDGNADAATAPLAVAAAAAAKAGWWDLAASAGTESAVAWTKLGDKEKALAAVKAVADAADVSLGAMRAAAWRETLAGRLPEDAALLVPVDAMTQRLATETVVGGDGGSGSAGLDGGGAVTAFARFHAKLAKGKPIATARGTPAGFDVRFPMKPDARPTAPLATGVAYVEESGVWLAFQGRSVALQGVDFRGGRDGPKGRWTLCPVRASYLVAEGETWSVSRDGIAAIGK